MGGNANSHGLIGSWLHAWRRRRRDRSKRNNDRQSIADSFPEIVSSVDVALYDQILGDLREDEHFYCEYWQPSREDGGPRLQIMSITRCFSAYQLQLEGNITDRCMVEPDILEDLMRRNERAALLIDYHPGFGVQTISRKRLEQQRKGSYRSDCIIQFASPGYSAAGDRAGAIFWFLGGVWAHSGIGYYLFQQKGNAWHVIWKELIYCV